MLFSSTLTLALASVASSKILASFDPNAPGMKIGKIGTQGGNMCPVQFPNCKGIKRTTDQVFQTRGDGYFRFNKAAKYDRAEVRGNKVVKWAENQTYYVSWSFAMSALPGPVNCAGEDQSCTVKTNRVFQFHQYDATPEKPSLLNIPLQLMVDGNGNNLTYYNKPNQNDYMPLWTIKAKANKTYNIILRITTSRQITGGITELWLDGQKQTLLTGGTVAFCPTWDGGVTHPKWGTYGAWMTAVTNRVGKIVIADTLSDVLPGASATESTLKPAGNAAINRHAALDRSFYEPKEFSRQLVASE